MKKSVILYLTIITANLAIAQSVNDAIGYIDNEQYGRAKTTLFNLAKSSPKPEVYYQLGNLYLKTDKPDSALIYFNKSKETDTKFALAQVGVGAALYQTGKKAEAKSTFDQVLSAIKNKNPDVLAKVVEEYVEGKDKQE